ncbi:uncharacterized protein KGF55_004382 [Candida pseudojiufengensis]|uniref:uncharacterized protein n=1 Tax=Candida pseudojiufengensis TaxID=497109 RepID=UPI002225A9CA|nr:uncharacterized protein KGF55_004382 [Candida pseudojiufengensis]KAI5960812.1 hypothetical protein KGF55_004382 [Candida pseudojiufengensis]
MNQENDESTSLLSSRRPSNYFLDSSKIGSFKGPNSFQNFANSFTRAQSFAASKIDNDIHKKRSFFVENGGASPSRNGNGGIGEEDETFDPELMIPSYRGERLSTVINDLHSRNQLFMNNPMNEIDSIISPSNNDVFYHDDIVNAINDSKSRRGSEYNFNNNNSSQGIPIGKKIHPQLSFSSLKSNFSITPSIITLKKIEDSDGNIVTVLAGQSTVPQTVFNSVNVLIGVGLLALPVGLMKAGWILGLPILIICGITTYWTATLLSKSMDTDDTIMTYADLGYAAYGSTAKLIISLLFSIDLIGAGVALIILFSDSSLGVVTDNNTTNKIITFFILTPFTFLPLPVLSIFSLLGIISTISITLIVTICGFLKSTSPGSLIEIMPTNLYPQNFKSLLLAIGILMAPFGGHAIFPNLKSDMRHPQKFTNSLKFTYFITLLTDCSMAIIGFLMFGFKCNNEITNNLLDTVGYPNWCYPLIKALICIIPLAKTPLNAKPIISSLDVLTGVNKLTKSNFINTLKSVIKFIIRIGVNLIFVILAILFPEFEKIIGILGASICFIICIILPCLFYLKLCQSQINWGYKIWLYFVVSFSFILAILASYAVITY